MEKKQEEISLDKEVEKDQKTLLWNKKTDAQSEKWCSGIHKNGCVGAGRPDKGTQD